MNAKKKRRQVCDERSIPSKYKSVIEGASCFYLHQVKILDANGCLRHLLELDRTWKGSSSQPSTKLTLKGILVPPQHTEALVHGVQFQTLRIVDFSLDFAGFLWAIGEGPKHEDYYYLILSPDKEYEPFFYRLLRFKYFVLHLNSVCEQYDKANTVQEALELQSPWQAEGGPLNDQEIAQDAPIAFNLLKNSFSSEHPVLLDLERLSATGGEVSTEEESQINENVANTVEEAPLDSFQDSISNAPSWSELAQVSTEKDKTTEKQQIERFCQMEGCSCFARDDSKYCSDECGLLKAFLTLRRLQYC
ncbi:hypothetical protein GpartN1_g1387.t1 [Galdieria partita]|uniref:Uncharacterized protein n=1 Tax=Galdieria partita TaxID=83374 RepID=A0A9C7UNJ9_9RHOD|nr:hypothetical protein GpartN1_g1387.t1 [Galdieria partita]